MAKNFNDPQVVEHYDDHIRKLIPGYELVHQQIHTLLALNLCDSAHVLIVGCGTGQELIALAQAFPTWQFTAIDPAQQMLHKLEQRLDSLNLKNKIQLIHGDTSVLKDLKLTFNAALSILVAHFVEDKTQFYHDINQVLNPKSLLISYDLMQFEKPQDAIRLQKLAELVGLHPKQSQLMVERLNQDFHLVSAQNLQQLYQQLGFQHCECFCQIFNYQGFVAYKSDQ